MINTKKNYMFEKNLIQKHIDPYGFKGILYQFDFETSSPHKDKSGGSMIAQRILTSEKFDKSCKQNAIHRDVFRKYQEKLNADQNGL
jgi:hypothetical protein